MLVDTVRSGALPGTIYRLDANRAPVATGRRFRVEGIGLETVGVEADGTGSGSTSACAPGERIWTIGDVNAI